MADKHSHRFRHICGQARKRAFCSPLREAARQGVRPLCLSCPHAKRTDSRAYTSLLISIAR